MRNFSFISFLVIALCFGGFSFSFGQDNPQAQNIFINEDAQQTIDVWNVTKPNTDFHSSFKPYLSSTLNEFSDTVISYYHFPIKNKFLSKTFNEGPSKRNQFNFQALPLVHLQLGYDMLYSKIVSETYGGAHVKLNINNDFTFANCHWRQGFVSKF